ncbi:MAG: penicillin-binding protein 2 [Treponema sp.]|nr:penicillin-binding protein 2 [Treponema sp.]
MKSMQSTNVAERKPLYIAILFCIIFITFSLYALHLYLMQIVHGSKYRSQSRTISSQITELPAQRGEIFDRNYTLPMVINVDSFAVSMIPGEIPEGMYDTIALKVAAFLGIGKKDIDKKVPPAMRRSFTAIEIKSNVPFSTISNIAENSTDLPGITWRSKSVRSYVNTGSISHVIGYVGDITKEEMNVMYNQGYSSTSIVGKTGIEKQYDSLLQGSPGREIKTVDVRGRILNAPPRIDPPQMGKNLVLTIDSRIQQLSEQALGDRVGAVVALKPATGEVLAMVSYPYYDPNIFNSDSAGDEYVKLAKGENNPLLNRAINAQYPPASTFKTVMSAAILNEKTFPSDKKIECTGSMSYGGRTFHCWVKNPGQGWLDLKEGLAQSCDIYFWVIGRDYLGVDRISYYAKLFGFGQDTQIDLPNRANGFVPTAQWKERRYHEKWLGGDTMSISIGQGYTLATPLQVANMMAMVSNNGIIYKPHLLKEVRDPVTNDVLEEIKPEVLFEAKDIEPEVWKELQDDLRYTITDGSGKYPMHNEIVTLAGKTGTAEVTNVKQDRWHSWLVAYGPYDGPAEDRIVVAVLVEAVNEWEWWAPYATNIIFQGIFANQTFDEAVDELGFRALVNRKLQGNIQSTSHERRE